jgi:Uma2 family endonuclease
MAEPAEKRWTVEEFLAWDDGTDRRYELVAGQIVAMAPPSEAHATIASI